MVIITYFGQRQKSAKNAENAQNFTDAFFMLFFYNLEFQNAGLVDVKRDLH